MTSADFCLIKPALADKHASPVITYRVFPDPQKSDVYFDIIHTPTDHAEPSA